MNNMKNLPKEQLMLLHSFVKTYNIASHVIDYNTVKDQANLIDPIQVESILKLPELEECVICYSIHDTSLSMYIMPTTITAKVNLILVIDDIVQEIRNKLFKIYSQRATRIVSYLYTNDGNPLSNLAFPALKATIQRPTYSLNQVNR